MDDYGNDVKVALLEQRMGAIEDGQRQIIDKLDALSKEISEARGGIRLGKWIAGIAVACASIGVTVYGMWK